MESAQIQSFFWSVFSDIRTEYERYSVSLLFSLNAGKYGPEKAPYFDFFHAALVQERKIIYNTSRQLDFQCQQ